LDGVLPFDELNYSVKVSIRKLFRIDLGAKGQDRRHADINQRMSSVLKHLFLLDHKAIAVAEVFYLLTLSPEKLSEKVQPRHSTCQVRRRLSSSICRSLRRRT
jgi:hypothetical protein